MAEERDRGNDDPYAYVATVGVVLACYGGWYWYLGQPIDGRNLSAAGAGLFLVGLVSLVRRGRWRNRRAHKGH